MGGWWVTWVCVAAGSACVRVPVGGWVGGWVGDVGLRVHVGVGVLRDEARREEAGIMEERGGDRPRVARCVAPAWLPMAPGEGAACLLCLCMRWLGKGKGCDSRRA